MIRHALIFAAGRGERMRPLTDTTPKPLLTVGGKRLIEYHLEALARAGVREVVINTSHLAEQFPATLGDGTRWGLHIQYSHEGPQPLETGGGMLHALPLLGVAPFIAVNADIFCDVDFSTLPQKPRGLAHLLMVDNPPQHPHGDFMLRDGVLHDESGHRQPRIRPATELSSAAGMNLTFAGIGVYRPDLLCEYTSGIFGLAPVLRKAMASGEVTGTHFQGLWFDIGTPQRLADVDALLRENG